jgi:hypothetical protein
LLADIQDTFSHVSSDRVSTSDLLKGLVTETSFWSEADRGKPLSSYGLSKRLLPFGIHPKDIRFGGVVRKGYFRADFEDAWQRYVLRNPGKGQQGQQASVHTGSGCFSKGQQLAFVADSRVPESRVNTRFVADVAPLLPPGGDYGAEPDSQGRSNGNHHCWTHPKNKTHWWLRDGADPVCELCHPGPTAKLSGAE